MHKVFGRSMKRAADDGVVARGAAIQTGIMQGEVMDMVLVDVSPHTLGIETKDGTFTPLIERNSTIPTRKSRVFTTVADNQTRVEVHVLQGESDSAVYNQSLATFEVSDLKPGPGGKAQIEVTFEIGTNEVLSVSAEEGASGRRTGMVIHGTQASECPRGRADSPTDDVKGLVLLPGSPVRAAEPEVAGTFLREVEGGSLKSQKVVVRQLEGLIANTIRAARALEGKLAVSERAQILSAAERAKAALAGGGLDELQARLVELERAAGVIGRAMLRP
jgi:molecular chaperone DnaK